MTNHDILILSIYVASAVLIGVLARKLILPYLMKLATRTKWKYDDIIIDSIKGWVVLWFLLGGVALALSRLTFHRITKK